MLIHLSKSIIYAIHSLYYMSYYVKDRPVMVRELCDAFDFPYDSVLKILRQLSRAKILMTHRGAKGGFTLRTSLQELNLLVLIEAIEGPVEVMDPLSDELGDKKLRDTTHSVFSSLVSDYKSLLKNVNCDMLFKWRGLESQNVSKLNLDQSLSSIIENQ